MWFLFCFVLVLVSLWIGMAAFMFYIGAWIGAILGLVGALCSNLNFIVVFIMCWR
jgi:glutamate synthase domain-containing protein 1